MSVVSALHASAAVLLVVAGAAKLWSPSHGVADLLGFRAPTPLVQLVGGSEVAVGVAALVIGGWAAWAVGLVYASFAGIVVRAVLADARSCGCFGRLDAPPSWIHVVGNLALAAVSVAAAGSGTGGAAVPTIVQEITDRPTVGVALAIEVVLLAGLALALFTALPEALGVRTRRGSVTGFRALSPVATGPAAPGFRATPPPTPETAAAGFRATPQATRSAAGPAASLGAGAVDQDAGRRARPAEAGPAASLGVGGRR